MHRLINADNIDFLIDAADNKQRWDMVFADPPDNIGLGYETYSDKVDETQYARACTQWIFSALRVTDTLWWSFNARHTVMMGAILHGVRSWAAVKPCVQTFTFGQHCKTDFGNNHRPLWRITASDKPVFEAEQIKVPSWRQLNGDKRAAEGGRVPGDVFDFPRVTGNSKQRRAWHPTQLHEGLVERCIKSSTREGGSVLDIFGGTGTTLRVCKAINRICTLVELCPTYCAAISNEHNLEICL